MPAPATISPLIVADPAAFSIASPEQRAKMIPLSERDLDPDLLAKAVLNGAVSSGAYSPRAFALWNRIVTVLRSEAGTRDLAVCRFVVERELMAALVRDLTGAPISEEAIRSFGPAALDRGGCGLSAWLAALDEAGVFFSRDYVPGEG